MLKYVAIIHVTHLDALVMYSVRSNHRKYMSPVCDDADSAKGWLEENIKEYLDSRNIVSSGIIAFDTEQSENAEDILEILINSF